MRRRTRNAEDWMYVIGDRLTALVAGAFAVGAALIAVINGHFFARSDENDP